MQREIIKKATDISNFSVFLFKRINSLSQMALDFKDSLSGERLERFLPHSEEHLKILNKAIKISPEVVDYVDLVLSIIDNVDENGFEDIIKDLENIYEKLKLLDDDIDLFDQKFSDFLAGKI